MDICIKKVGQRDGKDRFVLLDSASREVITVHDASEKSLRKYFQKRGVADDVIDDCFAKARRRYEQSASAAPVVDDAADTMEDDDLLFELGLGDD